MDPLTVVLNVVLPVACVLACLLIGAHYDHKCAEHRAYCADMEQHTADMIHSGPTPSRPSEILHTPTTPPSHELI